MTKKLELSVSIWQAMGAMLPAFFEAAEDRNQSAIMAFRFPQYENQDKLVFIASVATRAGNSGRYLAAMHAASKEKMWIRLGRDKLEHQVRNNMVYNNAARPDLVQVAKINPGYLLQNDLRLTTTSNTAEIVPPFPALNDAFAIHQIRQARHVSQRPLNDDEAKALFKACL